jgi:hypothetical protein
MTDLLFKEEVYANVGAAMDVYNDLGPGFLENVYQEAMDKLSMKDESQRINYLKATKLNLGVLINFGHYPNLEWKRLVLTQDFFTRSGKPGLLGEDSSDHQSPISED